MKHVGEVKSQNYLVAKFENLVDWAVNSSRANSLWPMPFGTACCAIEFMATAASRFDFARFGMERQAFSPRQADVLICAGRLPFKLAPVIRRIYDQMPQPKWVISMGACASTGGIFDNYAMVQGIDTIVPVDVYVPGCPPRPEGLLYGILLLHKKIKGESLFDAVKRREEQPLDDKGLRLPPETIDEISSIVSGGSRRPLSSSGCSSRRFTASNSDSPLIFLWRSRIPYNKPSGRGGQPGTYTSTGTIVSMPCTIA